MDHSVDIVHENVFLSHDNLIADHFGYCKGIYGATKQKQSLGCTQFTMKVCNLPEELSEQIAHFHSKLCTPK